MIRIEEIFKNKALLSRFRENFFLEQSIGFNTGLTRPIIYIVDRKGIENASYFNLHSIEDTDYDIHVISHESTVLLYLINLKVTSYLVLSNGVILRRRPPHESDRDKVIVKYSFDEHFQVLTNNLQTCSIFARNISADPTT